MTNSDNVQSVTASFPGPGQLRSPSQRRAPSSASLGCPAPPSGLPHGTPPGATADTVTCFPSGSPARPPPRTPHCPQRGSSARAQGLPYLVPEMCEIRHPEGQTSPAGPGAGGKCFILTRPVCDSDTGPNRFLGTLGILTQQLSPQ